MVLKSKQNKGGKKGGASSQTGKRGKQQVAIGAQEKYKGVNVKVTLKAS